MLKFWGGNAVFVFQTELSALQVSLFTPFLKITHGAARLPSVQIQGATEYSTDIVPHTALFPEWDL